MKFIKLTDRAGNLVWVNMALIIGMSYSTISGCNARLDVVAEEDIVYPVKETPEQIMELIVV